MAKFRKKPVVIEAVCWNGQDVGLTDKPFMDSGAKLWKPDWLPPVAELPDDVAAVSPAPGQVFRSGDTLIIGTLEGPHCASPGDWIIRGVKGELYPCKPDIFAMTYEPVD